MLLSCGRERVRLPLAVWALVVAISLIFATRGFAAGSQVVESRGLVNASRAEHGLGALSPQEALDRLAQQHANEMAAADKIYHWFDIDARADAAGVRWTSIGENVGVGPTVKDVHTAFMQSPGHRQNVLFAPYNVIGVGVAIGKDGSVFVAHEFAEVHTAVPAKAAVAPAAPKAQAVPAAVHAVSSHSQKVSSPAPKTAISHAAPSPAKSAFPNALQNGRVKALPL